MFLRVGLTHQLHGLLVSTWDGPLTPYTQAKMAWLCDPILPMVTEQDGLPRGATLPFIGLVSATYLHDRLLLPCQQ